MEETKSRFNRICVFCGSSSGKKASYQEAAVELGKELVTLKSLPPSLSLSLSLSLSWISLRVFPRKISTLWKYMRFSTHFWTSISSLIPFWFKMPSGFSISAFFPCFGKLDSMKVHCLGTKKDKKSCSSSWCNFMAFCLPVYLCELTSH